MACYLIDRSLRASLGGKVAEEVWTGDPVNFDHLRIFGCPAYVHVPSDEKSKLDLKSKQCIFLGYKKAVKGYKFWDSIARKMVISRDAVFDEQFMLQQHQDKMPKDSSSSDTLQMELEPHPVAPENRGGSHPSFDDLVAVQSGGSSLPTSGGSTINELQAYNLARDKQRRTNVKPPSGLGYEDMVSFALLVSGDEPTTFHGAITSQEKKEWMGAMVEEMESLQKNCTWELVKLSEGKKAIGCKWVYKKKLAVSEKEGEKFKARLGSSCISSQLGSTLRAMDVKITFLHGDLEEQIYMEQPDGFTQPGHEHLVCKLKKSLYGLKQSPRQWYKQFDSYMLQIGYKRCEYDYCVYVKTLMMVLYFSVTVLDRFGMSKAKPMSTPLANHFKLSSQQCPKTNREIEDMTKVPYASAVGCLMYAIVCTRPDLAHAVSQVCKYMSKPGRHHWEAVKWIFRYLKGTVRHGIIFGSQQNDPLVVGYVDYDYAGDLDDRRSTTRYVFTLGRGPICWRSTVQSIVALSTTEVE
ncbi:UNVERIFIED_CONTAM: Retrovirus-related Pol polyprotein from transposon TNT 1-94 [Sesamum latifolium]|uniref:Retrovirus-related Pol polyprotein from transposon TNT 1-94 n=1 Tax=Sesamum latifolium TaxID=2727402 RepID=A0AAW2WF23_9LAMI